MSLRELLGIRLGEKPEPIPVEEYLRQWKTAGTNAHGRLLKAFGEPKLVDTSKDERLGRIFSNRTLTLYPAFDDFFGIEEVIELAAQHLKSAADGLVGARQIQLYYGPPGSGKSSFATRLRDLAEEEPMWVLAYEDSDGKLHRSPVLESPLGIFQSQKHRRVLSEKFGVPSGRFVAPMSLWAAVQLNAFGGDLTRFKAVLVMPSQAQMIGIAKVAPGQSRAGDVSALIGIGGMQPSLEGYAFVGGLNRTTQGLL